ncbi:MAG: hypothetical protein ACRDVW_06870 [Acidimicrobiales bacterium]
MRPEGGGGLFVRQYLLYAKAWQRAGIVLVLVAAGVMMLIFGRFVGLLPALLGVVLGLRMWGPRRLRASHFQRADRQSSSDGSST